MKNKQDEIFHAAHACHQGHPDPGFYVPPLGVLSCTHLQVMKNSAQVKWLTISCFLRAWYKLLYSAGEESGNNMWRSEPLIVSFISIKSCRYIMDMVKIKRRNENRQRSEDKSTKQQEFEDTGV